MVKPYRTNISKDQSRDAGMALVLLLLLAFLGSKRPALIFGAIAAHVLNMLCPQIYKPFAVVWLGVSDVLGAIVPKVVLSIIYFAVITPIGFLRRLAGKDSLQLRTFKASRESVMVERNHIFRAMDIERPY